MNILTVQTLGPQLIALLGMPKNVTSFDLHCAAGQAVIVKCEFYPEGDAEAIGAALAEYELVPRPTALIGEDGPEAIMRMMTGCCNLPTEHYVHMIGFDAWLAERTEAAHQAMMAQVRAACRAT